MSEEKRVLPQSDLDLQLMTIDSVWGKQEINKDLKAKLSKFFVTENKEITMESLWGLLGFYTRDMRLANLSQWNGEFEYCQYYLDLANDLLQAEMIEPFLVALSRVATMLELSQSKGGFLRRNQNTLTTKNLRGELDPPKKKLFGSNKKEYGGDY